MLFFRRVRAPELSGQSVNWLNVAEPPRLEKLRGRLVILDFWTSCCINCIHMVNSLRYVEEMFGSEVAIIGIHCPKFPAEKRTETVFAALARYDIQHPVAHDPDFQVWRAYNIRAWPTLVFISRDGYYVGQSVGEVYPERLANVIRQKLDQTTAEILPELTAINVIRQDVGGRLRFPSKIKAAPGPKKEWVLADSGHHQVTLLDDEGVELLRYGSGNAGFKDGNATNACFSNPQGLIATRDDIFVADTGNHAICRIDRKSGIVETLAGDGDRGVPIRLTTIAKRTALASPWDVEIVGNRLFFANAGTHQLGLLNLSTGQISPFAGSGYEGIKDAQRLQSTLAQPSALAHDQGRRNLYFLDAETSALRRVSLNGNSSIGTLIGSGLFDFGHKNGPLKQALLQHPLGIAVSGQTIAIADSYNRCVRIVDLASKMTTNLDNGEFTCLDSTCHPLAEPTGVAFDGPDRLLVVDSSNHRVIEYDIGLHTYATWSS